MCYQLARVFTYSFLHSTDLHSTNTSHVSGTVLGNGNGTMTLNKIAPVPTLGRLTLKLAVKAAQEK